MKLFNDIKRVSAGLAVLALAVVSVGCDLDGEVVTYPKDGSDLQHADPYLQVVTGFIPFEIGTEAYDVEFNVINGTDAVSKVRLLGSFFDAQTGKTSNEVVFGEYTISDPNRTVIEETFTYDDLRTGLTIDGTALPESDEDIFPGSGWTFRFEGDYAAGDTRDIGGQINMVLSKYAGIYETSETTYMRIQYDLAVFPGDGVAFWDGNQVFIGFVDENTLSYNDNWGYFPWGGKYFYFSYDETGKITEFEFPLGSYSGTPATCSSPTAFANLSDFLGYDVCAESNYIEDNDVTGAHVIKLTYGYLGAGGYRQFTETLTKVVD